MNKIPFDLPQVEHDGATWRGDRGGVLQIFDVGDEDGKISPRQWLLGSVFCRGTLSGLISQGAAGKTTFRILQVIALSSGRNLTGDYIHVRCRVLIICLEDDLPELRRRVRAAMLHHGIKPEDVKGYLFLTTPRDLKIAELDERGRVKAGALYTAIGDVVSQLNLDLVCLDPAIKAHSVDENSNPQIDAFASLLTGLAQTKNIGVDLLSHERKSLGAEAGDANRQRGAGALKDAARLVYTLTTMGKEDAEALGVGEVERKSIFRIDSAKVNIAPPDATTRWFRLIGVHIGNGTADYPSGDNVQACEPWKAAALFDGLTTGDLNKALQKLGAGMGDGRRYSAAPNARDRAAWKAVKDQFPDVEPARCKGIVTIWLKSGVFEIGEYEDAQRKPAVGILSAKLIGEEIS
jgi:AAA domain